MIRDRATAFLAFMSVFGLMQLITGAWEWLVGGAVHNLIAGGLTVSVTGLAWWLARRGQTRV